MLGEGVRLTRDVDPNVGVIKIDLNAWEHTLTSLALNAHEAMKGRGSLLLRTRRAIIGEEGPLDAKRQPLPAGDYVCLSIEDEGPGIPEKTLAKIFDPFFSTKESGGSGLGLSTCWGIVQQAGGTIHVQSRLGAGTRFEIYLPRKTTLASDSLIPPRSFSMAAPRGRLSILVVDDEPAIVQSIAALLEQSGHDVQCAESGRQALKRIESGSFELVISDILMPQMSGVELAEELEQRDVQTPLLLMTGYSPDHESLRGAGRFPLITKPFKLEALLEKINQLLPSSSSKPAL
jgi:two-component system cell cycle sensor histidine kinase/response regulator CckA